MPHDKNDGRPYTEAATEYPNTSSVLEPVENESEAEYLQRCIREADDAAKAVELFCEICRPEYFRRVL